MMRINETGLAIIRRFEVLRLTTYICPAGVLTIGWGHTGADVRPGMTITRERAVELLNQDVDDFEACVSGAVRGVLLTSDQFSALVSFAFNVGCAAFQKSTLLRLLRACDLLGAADQFPRWNKSKGIVLRGLTHRRRVERTFFLGGGHER